jgi:hypothetical protein
MLNWIQKNRYITNETRMALAILSAIAFLVMAQLTNNEVKQTDPKEITVLTTLEEIYPYDIKYNIDVPIIHSKSPISIEGWEIEQVYVGDNAVDQIKYNTDTKTIAPNGPGIFSDKQNIWGNANSYTAIMCQSDAVGIVRERIGFSWKTSELNAPRLMFQLKDNGDMRLYWNDLVNSVTYTIYSLNDTPYGAAYSIPKKIGQTTNNYYDVEFEDSIAYIISSEVKVSTGTIQETTMSNIVRCREALENAVISIDYDERYAYEYWNLPTFVELTLTNGDKTTGLIDYSEARIPDQGHSVEILNYFGQKLVFKLHNDIREDAEKILNYVSQRQQKIESHIVTNGPDINIIRGNVADNGIKSEDGTWKTKYYLQLSKSNLEHYLKIKTNEQIEKLEIGNTGLVQRGNVTDIINELSKRLNIEQADINEITGDISIKYRNESERLSKYTDDFMYSAKNIKEAGRLKKPEIMQVCSTLEDVYISIYESPTTGELYLDTDKLDCSLVELARTVGNVGEALRRKGVKIKETSIHSDFVYVLYEEINGAMLRDKITPKDTRY